jgi:hypothetical protein
LFANVYCLLLVWCGTDHGDWDDGDDVIADVGVVEWEANGVIAPALLSIEPDACKTISAH